MNSSEQDDILNDLFDDNKGKITIKRVLKNNDLRSLLKYITCAITIYTNNEGFKSMILLFIGYKLYKIYKKNKKFIDKLNL